MKQIRLSGEKCTLSHPEAFSTAWRQIEKQSSQKVHIEKNPLIASRQIITKHWPELVDAVNGWKR